MRLAFSALIILLPIVLVMSFLVFGDTYSEETEGTVSNSEEVGGSILEEDSSQTMSPSIQNEFNSLSSRVNQLAFSVVNDISELNKRVTKLETDRFSDDLEENVRSAFSEIDSIKEIRNVWQHTGLC